MRTSGVRAQPSARIAPLLSRPIAAADSRLERNPVRMPSRTRYSRFAGTPSSS